MPGLVRDPIHLFLNSPDGACPGPKALHDTPLSVPTVHSRACVAPHASQSRTELVFPHQPHPQLVVSSLADGTTIQEGCLGQHSGLIFEAFSLYSSNSNVPVRPADTQPLKHMPRLLLPASPHQACAIQPEIMLPPGGTCQCLETSRAGTAGEGEALLASRSRGHYPVVDKMASTAK